VLIAKWLKPHRLTTHNCMLILSVIHTVFMNTHQGLSIIQLQCKVKIHSSRVIMYKFAKSWRTYPLTLTC